METTRFTVNGKPVELQIDPKTPLLWALRKQLGLTGTKFGCGMALCGACTVHVNGNAVRSCVTPVSAVRGQKHILDRSNYICATVNRLEGPMPNPGLDPEVAAIRAFNRLYTRKIGVVDGIASSPFSLAEARVLYELAHREQSTATDIRKELGLDAGYMSRILRDFERRKLVRREQSKTDERQRFLSLTVKGRRVFAPLDERSNRDVAAMLDELLPTERKQLVDAVQTVHRLLGGKAEPKTPYLLRQHHPGDMGWIVHRQAILYAEEYGWDGTYEALAAEIVAQFIKNYDMKRERCWIAEKDAARVGAVFVAKASDEIAKLRLLHVELEARGLGIGKRLVEECVRFARQAGYSKMTLWTQSILHAARHLYKQAGFQVVREEQHHSFGKDLTAETWELDLRTTT